MKKTLHKLMLGSALAGLIAVFAFPVAAQVNVAGTGTLTAEGSGRAIIRGAGTVEVLGSGVLYINDRAGDAVILVDSGSATTSSSATIRRPEIRYRFTSSVSIQGSDFTAGIQGREIQLSANGTGTVHLRGQGTYTVNGTQGNWSPRGVTIQLGQ